MSHRSTAATAVGGFAAERPAGKKISIYSLRRAAGAGVQQQMLSANASR